MLILSGALPACRQSTSAPAAAEPARLLTLWHTFNPDETPTLNRILATVRERDPGLTVQATVIPFARAQNELRRAGTACGVGAPDLFRAELPWVAELVSRDLVHPVPRGLIDESGYLAGARQAVRYKGQRWMLPASLDCLALLHNRALAPEPPRTLKDLVRLARQLTLDSDGKRANEPGFTPAKARQWGLYVRGEAYWFLPFLWAEGGGLFDPTSLDIKINQPAAQRALGSYGGLIRRLHAAAPNTSPSDDYLEMTRLFGRGKVAMIVNGPWAISALLREPAFEDPRQLGVAPFPRGAKGEALAPFSGHGYMVSKCAKDPAAAWKLAAALAGMEAQVRFARESHLLPALTAAYHQPGVRDDPIVSAFAVALKSTRGRPRHPAMARIFDDFTPAVQAVLQGDAQPAEALDGVARAWRRLLGPALSAPDAGVSSAPSEEARP